MTTYPLSEPATIYAAEADGTVTKDVLGQGSLAECADMIADMPSGEQKGVSIQMDDLDLRYGPRDIGELLQFLRDESAGLSNTEIAEIKNAGHGGDAS